ncbi:MAG: phosphopantothenoylcysteine decarboxylase [Endomicrobium sp.]|jgi:phosphopantothenoylcysteine synthetase/decarboxylase|nr:phosphopantothenoylcysteine decarboxylase [Endomicrobium sp.]
MLKKLTFLILSGPTKEYIDSVRFISNDSSGMMGRALANAVTKKGYRVIFISGPVNMFPTNVELIKVTTALEMFKKVKLNFSKANIIISVAAISDYRPVKIYEHKIKKEKTRISIEFEQNPDIIKYCGKNKKNQVVVGFALETENLVNAAKLKLKNKKLDIIVANGKESFNSKVTTVYIISSSSILEMKNKNKKLIAEKIIYETIKIFRNITSC